MIKRTALRGARFAARLIDAVARRLGEVALLVRLGPRGYARHRTAVVAARRLDGATFANSVTTTLTPARADGWHRVHWRHVVVVVTGAPQPAVAAWLVDVVKVLRAHVVLAPSLAEFRSAIPSAHVTIADGTAGAPALDAADILDWMRRLRRRWDLVFIDVDESLPDPARIVELQHAAHEYHHDREIGFVTPAYQAPEGRAAGFDLVRRTGRVVPAMGGTQDYGQSMIPRYVLTAGVHGLYITTAAIDRIDVAGRHIAGMDLALQLATLIRRGWAGNFRTLCLASTALEVRALTPPPFVGELRDWALQRTTSGPDGATRIIFVLNATSISGGIRIVFELANGLAARGFDVEIWSLQGAPTWFDLRVPLRTYRLYEDLLLSLRSEDAIKVATWWETADVVWLASVNHGVPAYLVQEFETWFYPTDAVAQAAVVASYRPEMIAETEASYQRQELAEVGLEATLIPNGYDVDVFRPLAGWQRSEDAVLAIGRSFFQKNFAMTERAWRSLGDDRPPLLLFGTEPDVLEDPRVTYYERPTDAEVNELYNTAAVFVQTSRHEGFCLPILEAMAAGCPVITTDAHGNREFCHDDENCVMVPQDDDVALAEALRALLADPARRARLAEAGLRTAAEYGWPVVLDRVAAFYADIARSAAAGLPMAEAPVDRAQG